MALRIQSFCHVTFAFLPFAGVADLAHALVQLGGVLANGIRVAVIEPQGALIHVCKETAGSGGAGDGEGGTRPARTADRVVPGCRHTYMHTYMHVFAIGGRNMQRWYLSSHVYAGCTWIWMYL